jgi:alpha-N-arabinofuranosidase
MSGTLTNARLVLDTTFVLADIDPRIYGNFVEHLGRCVYGGIYEPGHPTAMPDGWRGDVLALTRELAPPLVRYPGGNFVSAYNWEDGVGPREQRPERLDFAWRVTESNQVGTNEFMDWCKLAGTRPLMAVNLGTRGIEDARRLLEYCNHPGGSALSDLRIAHGYPEPHAIKTWCLGNEMDGPWQTGHKTADEYGRLAAETARAMRQFDDNLELVVCGSCSPHIPTFPEWDRVVLEHTYDQVDFLSMHLYVSEGEATLPDYLAKSALMADQLRTTIGLCDFMQAKMRSKKRMMICFDEWNVWDQKYYNPADFHPWQHAPAQVEQPYRLVDAIVFATLLLTLLKHAARVRIACVAQLVNVIAPIMTETGGPCWKQAVFYPLLHASRYGRGELLDLRVSSPVYESKDYGTTSYLEAVATHDPATGDITIFAVNRHLTEALPLTAVIEGDVPYQVREHLVLADPDPQAVNTADQPDRLVPRVQSGAEIGNGRISVSLPALSWNVLRLTTPSEISR